MHSSPTSRPLMPAAHTEIALVDIHDLTALTRMSRSWIHSEVRAGRFPQPVIRTPRCTRWLLAHVSSWITARVEQSAADTESTERVLAQAKKASDAAKARREKAANAARREVL